MVALIDRIVADRAGLASSLHFPEVMISKYLSKITTIACACLMAVSVSAFGDIVCVVQTKATAPPQLTPEEKRLVSRFDSHVKDYMKQRALAKKKLKPLSKDSTPEEIDAFQKESVHALQAMRAGTKQGYIFTPEFTKYVRTLIATEFPAKDRAEIKQTILDADTKGVPLKVNYTYPEAKEQAMIPPTLLLKLPQLPKEVKYRFVGRNLLLVDSDNALIVDYTLNAMP